MRLRHAKVKWEPNFRREMVFDMVMSPIKRGLLCMVPDLVYEFQKICLSSILVIERKPDAVGMDGHMDTSKT